MNQATGDKISFKPKEASRRLLAVLAERAREVVSKRFGLDADNKCLTLEAIGKKYSITRERVRQIENFALAQIRKADVYQQSAPIFAELKKAIDAYGGIVHERQFLEALSRERATQNHLHFLLVLSELFTKLKEDDEFHHRWATDPQRAEAVHQSLRQLCQRFGDQDLIPEDKLIASFVEELRQVLTEVETVDALAQNWLRISKVLGRNPLGEWGLAKSPNIKMRGIRDYAYLVLRRSGQPLHFGEVARQISKQFTRPAHPATCHNELIKDKRFVLVGRGLYALVEWGYQQGIVRDVIKQILTAKGPLTKEEVVAAVRQQRQVKDNTIIVNLQNPKWFKKNKSGQYTIV